MRSKIKQWVTFIFSIISFLGIIVGGILFGLQKTTETTITNNRTQELIKEAIIECDQRIQNRLLAIACTSNYWGRWIWYWIDENGIRHLLQDDLYAKDVGALFSTNPVKLEVYFMAVDGRKAFLELNTTSILRDCTSTNDCFRVNYQGEKDA